MSTTATFSKKTAALIAAFLTIFAALTLNPIAAHAAAGFNISGTVTESVGSAPLGGVTVAATSATGGAGVSVSTTTAANGSYTFTAPESETDWVITFSKSGFTTGSLTAISNAVSAQTGKNKALATAATAATVSGTIRTINSSSVTALASGATVVAYRGSVSTDTVTTTTDSNGAYTLSLPAGTYTLGFSLTGTVSQYLGNVSTLAAGTTFDIASSGTATKDATLTLQGTLTGTTTPGGVSVVLRKADGTQVATATSAAGATGAYSIANIDPGTYYVEFSISGYISEAWNDWPAFLGSTAISITAGNTTSGISPTLVANPGLGTVSSADATATVSGNPIEGATLTASSSGWSTAGTVLSYQWQTNDGTGWVDIPNAITTTYLVKADDYNKGIRVKVFGNKLGYLMGGGVNSTSTALVTHAFTSTPVPTITGTAAIGQTLTAVTGTWLPTPDTFTYQWYYGGAVVPGATASTLDVTNFVAGYAITVAVTAVKTGYPNTAMTSLATAAVGQLMTTTPSPTISGTAAVGKTLTVVNGTWAPSTVAFTYQWYRSGYAISGATGSSYSPVAADVGYYLSVTEIATLTGYTSTTVSSASTAVVLAALSAATPTISGSTTIGSVLTATAGTWGPVTPTLSYQWYRGGVAISGATASTYTLTADDDTKTITVIVTGTASGYDTATATSAAFLVGKQFTLHPTPTIKGNAYIGQTLTATIGSWDSGATLTHQWYRNGVAITGARWHTYKLTAADVGARITFTSTATASGFVPKTETSAATAVILNGKPFTKAPTPTISGNLRVGATLTAYAGGWSPAATKVTYQWLRGGTVIVGANKSAYKLTAAEKGYLISVRVVVTKSGFATTTKTSKLTTAVK